MATLRRYQIKQGTSSPWAIFTDDGQHIFADHDFRNSREAIQHLGAIASAEGLTMLTKEHPDKSVLVDFLAPGIEPPPRDTYMLTLEMTPEIHASLSELARDTGQSLNDVIRSALGMYKIAVDANKNGNHVGIYDKQNRVQMYFF
jgi:predicted HicB family RNase H-like nuclease